MYHKVTISLLIVSACCFKEEFISNAGGSVNTKLYGSTFRAIELLGALVLLGIDEQVPCRHQWAINLKISNLW